jgi:endonuclease YncB( thermonuclease family)
LTKARLRRRIVGITVLQMVVKNVSAERVVRVIDAASIVIGSVANDVEVRIANIDAPELQQP